MKAYVLKQYGAPDDALELREIEKPIPKDDQVLIRVRAAGLNAADWHLMRGDPYLVRLMLGVRKPKAGIVLGGALSGVVEAAGKTVTLFRKGDEVFAENDVSLLGAFGEYVCVPEKLLCTKPSNMTFEQAAAVPVSAPTALQGIRDTAKVLPGQKVLINGASGGVGTAAVQIAKAMGAEVTAVCSTKNLELVQSLGADHAIDYTVEDFTKSDKKYDVVMDIVTTHPIAACCQVLTPKGIYVGAGGLGRGVWIGKTWDHLMAKLNPFNRRRIAIIINLASSKYLNDLKDLIEAEKFVSPIEKSYTFDQVPAALKYLEEGHVRGKVVVTI
ncbi:Zinc-binding oxidoreductase [Klebsormidium nitens]|uniref:Zinc-binding oxidoreductase n=1 Tax=Klebsormidium nitens TaxID=105231 RepID=A0A1Y1HH99_KLENI|nr:Zinc-binding oxidoreductase [Klebsormidium nitens]|eukprot:GAQ77820.1 Zinc-binding oxidoreductase [Klebsormidium nitens]